MENQEASFGVREVDSQINAVEVDVSFVKEGTFSDLFGFLREKGDQRKRLWILKMHGKLKMKEFLVLKSIQVKRKII